MTQAMIFIPASATPEARARCHAVALAHVAAEGYALVSMTIDGFAEAWDYAEKHRLVLVVGDRSHIPADLVPRVEVADPSADAIRPRRRRLDG